MSYQISVERIAEYHVLGQIGVETALIATG
jgi:hypothetical protein